MTNPWLASSPQSPALEPQPTSSSPSALTGARAPQPGVNEPDVTDRMPRREVSWPASVWWLGAHGGAGETTLATLMPGTRAAGHAWPIPADPGTIHRVVLVARSSFAGLTAARKASIDWASGSLGGGVQLAGVALMADAHGRLPKPLRDLEQLLAGGVPRVWDLPWVEAWRYGPPSPSEALTKEFRAFFSDLSLSAQGVNAHH